MRDTAIIVWPVLGTEIPEAHVTITFLGQITKDPEAFDKVMEAMQDGFNLSAPGKVDVIGHEALGSEFRVEAAILDNTLLTFRQKRLMRSLEERGIYGASEYSKYLPHVSIRPWVEGQEFDTREFFVLDKPQVWWGDAKLEIDSVDDV